MACVVNVITVNGTLFSDVCNLSPGWLDFASLWHHRDLVTSIAMSLILSEAALVSSSTGMQPVCLVMSIQAPQP